MASEENNVLSPDHIVGLAAQALAREDGAPPGGLKSSYEAIALIGHACMVAVDFRLVGLGEDHHAETPSESPLLPAEWNEGSTFAFRYAHSQSSMQYLLKVGRLGDKAVVFALALGDDKTTSFDLPVQDYVSASALPLSSEPDLKKKLGEVFISQSRLADLVSLFKINVIQKLAPGLHKEGYEDTSQVMPKRPEARPQRDPLREDPQPEPARPYPFDDPLAAGPRRPQPPGDFPPPGFEDEYEIYRPPRGYPQEGNRNPLRLGERDLYPAGLGPNDPFRGTLPPGLGGSGGGMHPTFDDPMFGGSGGNNGGYNPQAPPGARYDPVGPGDGPPYGQGRGPFGGGRGGGFGGFGGGFGGDII
ncbi:hypothetical protein ASPZODRAFT_134390 [Penicilliopsis zonata CBS 506.65]|uniref:Uncharacterized protein n=1 Tax=Penicilliopsis zonata CBS 506.65 TaxID=1073090 RepID=A0A1L9SCR5_9EURO|nr:hypothetical protein ASPZODRAFT_134390 [Penicilliopsis zonata CBS 506.65]OJJ44971.1 hypothetical protein ASPZODRAFT_134390 [Penicilliopsis zonata CBS 506.65]